MRAAFWVSLTSLEGSFGGMLWIMGLLSEVFGGGSWVDWVRK